MDEKRGEGSDLDDHIREEESRRGDRPWLNMDARRARQARLEKCRKLLQYGTEEQMQEGLRALGLKDGSREFSEAMGIWRASR